MADVNSGMVNARGDETLLDRVASRNPHLQDYLYEFMAETGTTPRFIEYLSMDLASRENPNLIYPVGDPIYIHVYDLPGYKRRYTVIQPELSEEERSKKETILAEILKHAPTEAAYGDRKAFQTVLRRLLRRSVRLVDEDAPSLFERWTHPRVWVSSEELKRVRYHIERDVIDHGIIEPILRDPYLEDIHSVGTTTVHVVHKVFGMLGTNVQFENLDALDSYLRNLSERIGRPVSDSRPIVDGALSDGSRINIIYSEDISRGGASFTIRRFSEKPPTMVQLIKWGTFSPQIAAYLWLALEHGMSIFMSGETASGKTTSLNAMLSFIRFDSKIYTAEDTPEVIVPQPVWQRLITREAGPHEAHVELFDLVKSALRSRPDYIVVGEVRGKEGSAAFQAIQTGHAVLTTFHASSIQKMIQRFTGDPINVPIRFMDNLNIALFQEIIYGDGRLMRRCSSVQEILRYSEEKGGVLTREIFTWDPVRDAHHFRGMYNSYVLENKIAAKIGYENVREIYEELFARAKIIKQMVDKNILDYDSVNRIFAIYSDKGFDAMRLAINRY